MLRARPFRLATQAPGWWPDEQIFIFAGNPSNCRAPL